MVVRLRLLLLLLLKQELVMGVSQRSRDAGRRQGLGKMTRRLRLLIAMQGFAQEVSSRGSVGGCSSGSSGGQERVMLRDDPGWWCWVLGRRRLVLQQRTAGLSSQVVGGQGVGVRCRSRRASW